MTDYSGDVGSMSDEDVIIEAKECYNLVVDAEAKQREREVEDLRFQVAEHQWDPKAIEARKGNGTNIAARPTMSVSKVAQPIKLVENQARQAKLGVNVHPVDVDAKDDTAETVQGIYRRIERDSNANDGRLWGFGRAIRCGTGSYRVVTKWDEDSGDSFLQEIGIERIQFQDSVYFDPSATKPDKSDAEWALVTAWVPWRTFRRQYKKARAAQIGSQDRISLNELAREAPDWVKGDGPGRAVLVAEYWVKEHNFETICQLGDGTVLRKEDVPRGAEIIDERTRDLVTVYFYKITGFEVLEKSEWLGRYIPLIFVSGEELQPIEGEQRRQGIVRPGRDAQRFFNLAISTMAERMAMEPKAPWVMAEGQDEGHPEWQQANYRNFSVLKYKPKQMDDGTLAPPPARVQLDMTGTSIAAQAAEFADQLVQTATATYDASLGKTNAKEESGRKTLALQGQSDAANSNWIENLSLAMNYEARVVLDLIPKVYSEPGRITTVLGGDDDKISMVMLNQPYISDPTTGRPVPAQEGNPEAKHYDLSKGRYTYSISIGKSFQTRLQQGSEEITRILEAEPQLLPVIGDIWMRFQDIPGGKEIADRLVKWREAKFPELTDDKDKTGAQKAIAENSALKQQLQILGQQAQEMQKALETEQVKHQAQVQIAAGKVQGDIQLKAMDLKIAEMNNAAKIATAQIAAETKGLELQTESQNEALATGLKISAEAIENQKDRDHETRQAQFNAVHDVAHAAAGGESVEMSREGGQEQGQEHSQETNQGASSESSTERTTEPQGDGSGD